MRLWTRLVGWMRDEARSRRHLPPPGAAAPRSMPPATPACGGHPTDTRLRWLRRDAAERPPGPATTRRSSRRCGSSDAAAGAPPESRLRRRRRRDSGWRWRSAGSTAKPSASGQENTRLQAEVTRLQTATADARQAGQLQSEQVQTAAQTPGRVEVGRRRVQQARGELEGRVAALREATAAESRARAAGGRDRSTARPKGRAQPGIHSPHAQEEELTQRTRQLERAVPLLEVQAAALQAQVNALTERNEC